MSNEMCLVTIADIYGEEWWERNKAELDREWEWEFGIPQPTQKLAAGWIAGIIPAVLAPGSTGPRIILHRRKPKPPTLREVYGVDEVTIPAGWEWTGEWRDTRKGETYRCASACDVMIAGSCANEKAHRLILRERPKKVWFKAEEKHRYAKKGEWFWSDENDRWVLADADFVQLKVLCATRHEETDATVQVVTQEDIDKCGR